MRQMFGFFILLTGLLFSMQANANEQINLASVDPFITGSTNRPQAVAQPFNPIFAPQIVDVRTDHAPGTIIIDTTRKFLYLVQENGRAIRYGVGVGRPGFGWTGTHRITRKAEWPDWRPPAEMRARQPYLPAFVPGGLNNPMGARALYLGSTLYRIHGTTENSTIGQAMSSGCIRMRNEDVTDLYERVPVGATVIVF